jgi:hypothetical protein
MQAGSSLDQSWLAASMEMRQIERSPMLEQGSHQLLGERKISEQ